MILLMLACAGPAPDTASLLEPGLALAAVQLNQDYIGTLAVGARPRVRQCYWLDGDQALCRDAERDRFFTIDGYLCQASIYGQGGGCGIDVSVDYPELTYPDGAWLRVSWFE